MFVSQLWTHSTLAFPLAGVPAEAAEVEPFRVMIVDDDPTALGILRLVAGRVADCECEVWSSAELALESCLRQPPHVIVVDHVMPQVTGLALINSLRATPATSTIEIIACTGLDDPVLHDLLRQRGARAVFRKPLDIAAFRGMLEGLKELVIAGRRNS
jgi:CheY-like chemotaxis protein